MEQINVYAEMVKFFKEYYLKTNKVPDTEVAKYVFKKYYTMATGAGFIKIEDLTQTEKDALVKAAGQSRIRCKILYLIQSL